MNAVITQDMCSTPSSSPTMVGRAGESTVWFSEDISMISISPMNSSRMLGAGAGSMAPPGSDDVADSAADDGAGAVCGAEARPGRA